MPQPSRHDQDFLELPEEEMSTEHLEGQVQKAHEALISLKRQQDHIEKQKRELEELSRRQEQLQIGRGEMVEKFTRAVVVLERETYEAQKRVELLQGIRDTFEAHLRNLEAINPKAWEGLDINRELNKALSSVDDAKAEYHKSLPKVSPDSSDSTDPVVAGGGFQMDFGSPHDRPFLFWVRAGFAFTLPLFVLGVLLVIAVFMLTRSEYEPVPGYGAPVPAQVQPSE